MLQVWNPRSNKLGIAPSAVDVLRMVDETMEAFFLLPILMHPVLLPELTSGLDKCMQHYVSKAKSSCGMQIQLSGIWNDEAYALLSLLMEFLILFCGID